jgi:hypothetical protein
VVVGQQGSLDRLAGAVVVPDRCGQGQDTLHDPDPNPGGGAAAVLFEIELPLQGVVDRLDEWDWTREIDGVGELQPRNPAEVDLAAVSRNRPAG